MQRDFRSTPAETARDFAPRPQVTSAARTRSSGAGLLALALIFGLHAQPGRAQAAGCTDPQAVTERLALRVAGRAALMKSVAKLKSERASPIYDGKRELGVLGRVQSQSQGADLDAALLFAQIQMDLAKQLQTAWVAELAQQGPTSRSASPPSLAQLRTRLDALGEDVSRLLKELRSRPHCNQSGLATVLVPALADLDAPVEAAVIDRYARMLAAAACTGLKSQ
jgi:chorismate mutase